MKRTPLERRTPLRAKVALPQGTALQRNGFLRRQSSKARAVSKARRQIADELEADAAGGVVLCEAKVDGVCRGSADDLHEPLTRARGGDPADPDEVMPVCRACHDHIHDNPEWAQSVGLLRSGTAPVDAGCGEAAASVGDRAGLPARTFLGGGASGPAAADHNEETP